MQPLKVSCLDHEGGGVGQVPAVGRQGLEADHRLDHLRSVDRAADDRGLRGAVRQGEGHHACATASRPARASCSEGKGEARAHPFSLPALSPSPANPMSAIPKPEAQAAPAYLAVSNIEVIYDHVILVLKGVSLQVAEGPHRGAARRQRRRQDDHPEGDLEPAARRARRGHQGLDRVRRQAHRPADAERPGAHGRVPGDGGAALLPAPDGRGEPAHRRVHALRSGGPSSPATSTSSTSISRGCASGGARSRATPPAASSR